MAAKYAFKSHDPAVQAKSRRFNDGLLAGLRDARRARMDPPRAPLGMDPAYSSSWLYREGYKRGVST